MCVLIIFSDRWTVPTVTFTRTDPVVHAENRWDPKTPAGSVWARAVCTLTFERHFKSEFPHHGGVLNFLILYFCTHFHSGFWLNGSRHISPPHKKEEKLQKRSGKKLQQSRFQVVVKKTHAWQSQSLTAGRGNPERLGKPSISGDFQRAVGQGLEKPHLSFRFAFSQAENYSGLSAASTHTYFLPPVISESCCPSRLPKVGWLSQQVPSEHCFILRGTRPKEKSIPKALWFVQTVRIWQNAVPE